MWNSRAARATRALNKARTASKPNKAQKALLEDSSTSFVPSFAPTPRAQSFVPSHGVK